MSLAVIRPYFGFTREPFGSGLSPSALHPAASHSEARARISYLIETQSLGLLTVEVGSGKTTALRAAVSELDPSRHTVIYLPNPAVGIRGLYTEIITCLGETPRFQKAALIAQTQELLFRERVERKRKVVVICDEAHLIAPAGLEELRLLTNVEMDSQMPFAGILVGQPELRRRLRMGSFAALDQRIALRYEISGMQEAESREYLVHHLKLAGREDRLFTDDAAELLHERSRGIPRALNNLALQALVATYANNTSMVDRDAAQAAVSEVFGE